MVQIIELWFFIFGSHDQKSKSSMNCYRALWCSIKTHEVYLMLKIYNVYPWSLSGVWWTIIVPFGAVSNPWSLLRFKLVGPIIMETEKAQIQSNVSTWFPRLAVMVCSRRCEGHWWGRKCDCWRKSHYSQQTSSTARDLFRIVLQDLVAPTISFCSSWLIILSDFINKI